MSSLQRPVPALFVDAVASLRAAEVRPEVQLSEVTPRRPLAPHVFAINGSVDLAPGVGPAVRAEAAGTGGEQPSPGPAADDAGGRLVLLHDPDPPAAWLGDLRVVVILKAVVEPELAADPLLAEVVWAWLGEELDGAEAGTRELGGTVTRVTAEPFGTLAERAASVQVELRASWTPSGEPGRHLEAWAALLCRLAGLPPLTPGVPQLNPRA